MKYMEKLMLNITWHNSKYLRRPTLIRPTGLRKVQYKYELFLFYLTSL